MEHQYPGAISGDENMLAELMLPDQAHVRNQDWTIFFLHKDTNEEEEKEDMADENTKEQGTAGSVEGEVGEAVETDPAGSTDDDDNRKEPEGEEVQEVEGGEGPPLIYVLNLVNTKQDTSAKRFRETNQTSCYSLI